MDDQERLTIAEQFATDWLEPDDADPADLRGYPRLACERVLFTMAVVALIEDIEHRAAHERSGGDLRDVSEVIHACLFGDHTT